MEAKTAASEYHFTNACQWNEITLLNKRVDFKAHFLKETSCNIRFAFEKEGRHPCFLGAVLLYLVPNSVTQYTILLSATYKECKLNVIKIPLAWNRAVIFFLVE